MIKGLAGNIRGAIFCVDETAIVVRLSCRWWWSWSCAFPRAHALAAAAAVRMLILIADAPTIIR